MRPTDIPSSKNPNSSPIPSGLLTREDPRFASQLKRIEEAKKPRDQPDQPQEAPLPPASPGGARRWEIHYGELKLEQKLGQGAFGEVFSGSYRKSKVAVKLYDFRGKLPSEQADMLLKEADVMEGLRSEYLVGFRGICLDPRYCLVMEFCEGGTLRARLDKTSEEIAPLDQLRWAMQTSYGLYQLHSIRIVHRDLKGENILLDKLNHAKVADFGLSIVKSHSASHSKMGASRGKAGTIPWMAPELHDDQSNSKETDVYSLGVVLWEIVSRKLPYSGLGVGQMISKTVQGKRDPLPSPCPEVFRLMITACWNLEAKQRPTAEQVGDQFAAALKSLESVPMALPAPESPKPTQAAGSNDEEMKKLLDEVMRMKLKEAEDDRRRVELEKMVEDHARLKEELEREREIKRREAELKKSPSALKPETPASSPPARQPEIKKPLTSEPVSPPSSVLSQSRFTLAPAPKPLIKPVDAKALSQLLQYVAEGEQDKAEELIKKDNNLLLHAGTVTDLSGREFKGITAFQYALWAMDRHMWTMIQKSLPREAQAQQFAELESKGTAHGKHFSLQPLTGALQTYVDNAEKVWKYDQRATDHWCKVVGGAQKMLPAHFVNEYCRGDRPFDPCPQEWESKLPRTREMQVYDSTQSEWVKGTWFVAPSSKDGLGLNFAFSRCSSPSVGGVGGAVYGWAGARGGWRGRSDLKALQSLWKTRTQQLELLKSELLPAASYSQVLGSSR